MICVGEHLALVFCIALIKIYLKLCGDVGLCNRGHRIINQVCAYIIAEKMIRLCVRA